MRRIFSHSTLVSSARLRFYTNATITCLAPLSPSRAHRQSDDLGSMDSYPKGFSRASESYDEFDDTTVRDMSPRTVLKTVRADPGRSTVYYAKKYFGGEQSSTQLNHILHTDLKRFGKIELRFAKPGEKVINETSRFSATVPNPNALEEGTEPIWLPLRRYAGRHHQVTLHRPEHEDLSFLESFVPEIPDFLKGDALPQPPKIPTIGGASTLSQKTESEALKDL